MTENWPEILLDFSSFSVLPQITASQSVVVDKNQNLYSISYGTCEPGPSEKNVERPRSLPWHLGLGTFRGIVVV